MLGQVATFMDTLHVTYREAFEEIPYRNLVIMSMDKMHTTDKDNIVHHDAGKDMMARRMAIMNQRQEQ